MASKIGDVAIDVLADALCKGLDPLNLVSIAPHYDVGGKEGMKEKMRSWGSPSYRADYGDVWASAGFGGTHVHVSDLSRPLGRYDMKIHSLFDRIFRSRIDINLSGHVYRHGVISEGDQDNYHYRVYGFIKLPVPVRAGSLAF